CYATANSEGLNDLLAFFLSPSDDLMVEYKQNFLLSEDGFRACRKLVNRKVENLLNEMIADCLPKATRNSINTIADLKELISENNLDEVKICVVEFLDNDDDIRTLKSLIYDNQIKAYKIRKMDGLQDSEVVSTMLKKGCHQSYWRVLTDWFFEEDHVEIAKFRKKNKGKNIASKVKFVRESYFKQK
ncbi:hypothetical protein U1Q18_051284, partial [Sarracenia purpurea var. burkii]